MLSITPVGYHGISLPTPASGCPAAWPLRACCRLSIAHSKLLPAPGAASLPSCRSSELVEQPLGKEAAGRNTLTWCQPHWHGWSISKGAFHLPSATLKWDFPTWVTWTKHRITSFAANLLFCSCCYGKYLCVVCVEKFLLCSAASPFASPCSKSSLG